MLEATQPGSARPVVLLGGKGQGKSHLIAALYHALTDPAAAAQWLSTWASQLGRPELNEIKFRSDAFVIVESLGNQNYKSLWNMLFALHPKGEYIRGKWEALGENRPDLPSKKLIMELFEAGPTVLLLDEFQTWFDGLTNTKAAPNQVWAFNFIQILSEIAHDHPDLLTLVVSIRENQSEAFQQMQRVAPVIVNFQGNEARRDRQRLLLYRIFENRLNVPDADIEPLIEAHVSEHLRLDSVPPSHHEKRRHEFVEAWPFSPMLMRLLEDQVLIATDAQENRDLIRILVELFKTRGEQSPVLTAADFLINESNSIIPALLNSVANQFHRNLQQKALRNLEAVLAAVDDPQVNVPNATEIISALWLRSLSVEKVNGAEPAQLQVDNTRSAPIDDNAFAAQLALIRENSFNIHPAGSRLVFKEEENAEGKLLANAKNDKLFQDGRDLEQLAKEIRYTIGGSEDVSRAFRVVVLRRNWRSAPWTELPESDRPERWEGKLTLLVLPEYPEPLDATLGPWLKAHVADHRNTIRFLLPTRVAGNVFFDRNLLVYARAVLLASEWKGTDPAFSPLATSYQREHLRPRLKNLFDSFALLDTWNFSIPESSHFQVEKHGAIGDRIPVAVQKKIEDELFVPEDFEKIVLVQAGHNGTIADLLTELQEPSLHGEHCIPWLGETAAKERLLRLCAHGKVSLVVRGNETLQVKAGETEDDCWTRIKSKVGTGNDLKATTIHVPGAIPQSGGATPVVTGGQTGGTTSVPIGGGTSPGSGSGTSMSGGVPSPGNNEAPPPNPFGGGSGSGTSTGTGTGSGTSTITPPPAPKRDVHGCPPKSGLNLLGEVEKWNIQPGATLHQVNLNISQMTGAQLLALVKVLPSGMSYALNLEKEQG